MRSQSGTSTITTVSDLSATSHGPSYSLASNHESIPARVASAASECELTMNSASAHKESRSRPSGSKPGPSTEKPSELRIVVTTEGNNVVPLTPYVERDALVSGLPDGPPPSRPESVISVSGVSSSRPNADEHSGGHGHHKARKARVKALERELGIDLRHRNRDRPAKGGESKIALGMIGADGIDDVMDALDAPDDALSTSAPGSARRSNEDAVMQSGSQFAELGGGVLNLPTSFQPDDDQLSARSSASKLSRGHLRKTEHVKDSSSSPPQQATRLSASSNAPSPVTASPQVGGASPTSQAPAAGGTNGPSPHSGQIRSHVGSLSTSSPVSSNEDLITSRPIHWRRGALIGRGSYGHVFLGLNIHTGEIIAVKQIPLDEEVIRHDRARVKALEQEINFLRSTNHPNVVKYLGAQIESDPQDPKKLNLNILLEYVPGGSVASLISTFGRFPVETVRVYTRQLLYGLRFLHRHGIIHRDIKGANILVDAAGMCKLADFGASARVVDLLEDSSHSIKGTPYWMAPEVICQRPATTKVDIWALGCTVIEMADGRPPWSDESGLVEVLLKIARATSPPPIPASLGPEGTDFVQKCLIRDPVLRPTADELLQHPFVASISYNGPIESPMSPQSQISLSRLSVLSEPAASSHPASSPLESPVAAHSHVQSYAMSHYSSSGNTAEDGAYMSMRGSLHLAQHILEGANARFDADQPKLIPIAPPSSALRLRERGRSESKSSLGGPAFPFQSSFSPTSRVWGHGLQRSVHPAVAARRQSMGARVPSQFVVSTTSSSSSTAVGPSNSTSDDVPSDERFQVSTSGHSASSRVPESLPVITKPNRSKSSSAIVSQPASAPRTQQLQVQIHTQTSAQPEQGRLQVPAAGHAGVLRSRSPNANPPDAAHPTPYPTPLAPASAASTLSSTMHVPLVTARAPAPDATTEFSLLGLGLGLPQAFGANSGRSLLVSQPMSRIPPIETHHQPYNHPARYISRSAAASPVGGRALGVSRAPIPEEAGNFSPNPFSGRSLHTPDATIDLQSNPKVLKSRDSNDKPISSHVEFNASEAYSLPSSQNDGHMMNHALKGTSVVVSATPEVDGVSGSDDQTGSSRRGSTASMVVTQVTQVESVYAMSGISGSRSNSSHQLESGANRIGGEIHRTITMESGATVQDSSQNDGSDNYYPPLAVNNYHPGESINLPSEVLRSTSNLAEMSARPF